MSFVKFVKTLFIQKTAEHGEYMKTYKRRLPLDTFEQFVSTSNGKLLNDKCLESVMGKVY